MQLYFVHGVQIREVYPVTSLKRAQEMLEVDPQLSDWDLDSGDGDVRAAINKDGGKGGNAVMNV